MQDENPVRDALANHRFCYMVELVASRLSREPKLLHVASDLAQIPQVVAGSVTSYAGGAMGHDPIRVGTAARARGLTPNIHITCSNRSVQDIRRDLGDLEALGIQNVFAITGDYPQGAAAGYTPSGRVPFGGDSVQLVEMIARMRETGFPFYISVAVSPFKYTEADCAYQYLKLEKKIAAGADYAITQLGFDAHKFRELKRYMDEREMRTPVFGNVYVLNARTAEKMSRGEPPGCWVSRELLEKIQAETGAPDKGSAARLERAAQMVAIVRGLGYAGAYLGGDHRAGNIRWIIQRSEALAPRWEELAEEMNYAPKGGFYFYGAPPKPPASRGILPGLMDLAGRLFPVNREGWMRSLLTAVFRRVDKVPAAAQFLERVEFAVKSPAFGCQACGNCVLGQMEYVCPMTCPKGLRNGPCGGTSNGQCEVVPSQPCIWVKVYDRAKAVNRLDDLRVYIPRPNLALQGTSSWINYFLDRDNRPGTLDPLVQITPIAAAPPASTPSGKSPAEAPAESRAESKEDLLVKSHQGGSR
jgi:methylenetetrahydrofolate reductase (NADPH)